MSLELENAVEATPASPSLGAGEIHVWHFGISVAEQALPAYRATLNDAERARADRFYREIHRSRFTAGRAKLRALLARYTGIEAGDLDFDYSAAGKPMLTEAVNERDLRFNLTHSEDRAVCAIARGATLGVDLEAHRENPELNKIARRFFATEEVGQLLKLPADQQLPAFYQCWTAKEALVKAWGDGLRTPLDRFSVLVSPERTTLLHMDLPQHTGQPWTVQAIPRPAGFAASLAYAGDTCQIRHFLWDAEP